MKEALRLLLTKHVKQDNYMRRNPLWVGVAISTITDNAARKEAQELYGSYDEYSAELDANYKKFQKVPGGYMMKLDNGEEQLITMDEINTLVDRRDHNYAMNNPVEFQKIMSF